MHPTRRAVRSGAAAIAAVMALIYFGIGLGVVGIAGASGDPGSLAVFGGLAGGAFLLGAVLLASTDRRWLWVLGVAFQLFVYWGYVSVSKQRTPPFEVWGITLRIVQAPLLAALVYLAARNPRRAPAPRAAGVPGTAQPT